MKLIDNSLKYVVGAVVGVAVYAGAQYAVTHHSEIEVKPDLASQSFPSAEVMRQEQLASQMRDGQVFAEKLAQNALSVDGRADVALLYTGPDAWNCQVRVSHAGFATTVTQSASSPERACVKAVLSLDKDKAL